LMWREASGLNRSGAYTRISGGDSKSLRDLERARSLRSLSGACGLKPARFGTRRRLRRLASALGT